MFSNFSEACEAWREERAQGVLGPPQGGHRCPLQEQGESAEVGRNYPPGHKSRQGKFNCRLLLKHMHPFLMRQQLDYAIYVVNQVAITARAEILQILRQIFSLNEVNL